MSHSGGLKGWTKAKGDLPPSCQWAFKNLCKNIDMDLAQVNPDPGIGAVFYMQQSRSGTQALAVQFGQKRA